MRPARGPVWGLVAAAGAGRRFGAAVPKQYTKLAGRPMLAHSIERLAADRRVRAVMVVVPRADSAFACLRTRLGIDVMHVEGGDDRSDSVANGLEGLAAQAGAAPEDWVLVHDAARPCLHHEDLAALIDAGLDQPTGALLAAPVRDTLKRARRDGGGGEAMVEATVPRERMWRALTPQMFRLVELASALAEASARRDAATDDAAAIEAWAARRGRPPPRLVEARHENLKVTVPGDLDAADRVLVSGAAGPG
ncbi:MAG: 2-C-methyl-D-erythritol 4-phosphate cytidylyltransferase [Immundisolibacterales bacterium]|nr:2-C-methyl-D-erythritol 4-phosphate cytidylyltransferase [Immundisolibacterales bacterium]